MIIFVKRVFFPCETCLLSVLSRNRYLLTHSTNSLMQWKDNLWNQTNLSSDTGPAPYWLFDPEQVTCLLLAVSASVKGR